MTSINSFLSLLKNHQIEDTFVLHKAIDIFILPVPFAELSKMLLRSSKACVACLEIGMFDSVSIEAMQYEVILQNHHIRCYIKVFSVFYSIG